GPSLSAGAFPTANVVVGNAIGIDSVDSTSLSFANRQSGVVIESAASNLVGDATPEGRNYIANNSKDGVEIASATLNLVRGNYVGSNATGLVDLGNTKDGISLSSRSTQNTIGGTTADARNVILGSGGSGILLIFSSSNLIQGNYVGTTARGDSN